MVFGDRNDLPDAYREMLADAGYSLLTIDYPLAPEAQLPEITLCLHQALTWFKEESKNLFNLGSADYVLFGRSAGAYLAFLLAARSADPQLKGLASFYGYYSLEDPSFRLPNAHYNTFPKVPAAYVQQQIRKKPLAVGAVTERFPLYLHARQTGKWVPLFLEDKSKTTAFNLTAEELQSLPPTFSYSQHGRQGRALSAHPTSCSADTNCCPSSYPGNAPRLRRGSVKTRRPTHLSAIDPLA